MMLLSIRKMYESTTRWFRGYISRPNRVHEAVDREVEEARIAYEKVLDRYARDYPQGHKIYDRSEQ